MGFPFLAAAQLGTGLISGITGLIQKGQANKMIRNNPFPEMQVPDAILNNQRIAEKMSGLGLPSEQYNMAKQNIDRNANTALSYAKDRKSGLAAIGGIQERSNDAALNLDSANAATRQQNQRQLMQQNTALGNWQNNVWDWNKRQKYLQTAASARALLGAGNQNLNIGVDRTLSGGLMGADYYNNGGSYSQGWMPQIGQQPQGNNSNGLPLDYATYLAIQQYLNNK